MFVKVETKPIDGKTQKNRWMQQNPSTELTHISDMGYSLLHPCPIFPPVDGSWLSWGEWSSCTTSCGLGTRYTHWIRNQVHTLVAGQPLFCLPGALYVSLCATGQEIICNFLFFTQLMPLCHNKIIITRLTRLV